MDIHFLCHYSTSFVFNMLKKKGLCRLYVNSMFIYLFIYLKLISTIFLHDMSVKNKNKKKNQNKRTQTKNNTLPHLNLPLFQNCFVSTKQFSQNGNKKRENKQKLR